MLTAMRLRDFHQDINKKFEILKEMDRAQLFRGLVQDISQWVETMQTPWAKHLLSSALEFVRPHHLALGLRFSRLSTTHVEVVVPKQVGFTSERDVADPGVYTTAAALGAQLLMRRLDLSDLGPLHLKDLHLQILGLESGEVRGRMEFTKLAQEALRVELKKKGFAQLDLMMSFFDESEKRIADVTLNYGCQSADQLGWKGSNEHHRNTN